MGPSSVSALLSPLTRRPPHSPLPTYLPPNLSVRSGPNESSPIICFIIREMLLMVHDFFTLARALHEHLKSARRTMRTTVLRNLRKPWLVSACSNARSARALATPRRKFCTCLTPRSWPLSRRPSRRSQTTWSSSSPASSTPSASNPSWRRRPLRPHQSL